MDKINSEFGDILIDLNEPWLSAGNLMFANAIHDKEVALNNTWGFFIYATVCPISW